MDIQVIALASVKSVLKREVSFGHPLMYVLSHCTKQGPSAMYGTLPWNEAYSTLSFRQRHTRKAGK